MRKEVCAVGSSVLATVAWTVGNLFVVVVLHPFVPYPLPDPPDWARWIFHPTVPLVCSIYCAHVFLWSPLYRKCHRYWHPDHYIEDE